MSRRAFLAGLVGLTFTAGCSRQIDLEARFDKRVEQSWTKDTRWVDAVAHLSSGGLFIDTEESDGQLLDTPHVLPLLQRLAQEFSLEWQAVTQDVNPKQALVVVARLNADSLIREKIERAIVREQQGFPGMILYQWGHRWLSINFLNQEQADLIKQGMK
jgi:hypothetical protein